ncbi:MAG TPA: M20/M25/M40 family metallo-hydrolase [Anaerolineales bacterium]|nr:M20/M25/M40 family metallo-hydrolase [Anaerolineales bacterium]
MKPLIRKLVEAYGPSGHEEHVREMIRAEIKGLADYVSVDPLGNLIAVIKKKSKSGKKVMLAAHMDEIGVMVTHIDSKGFVRIVPVGGVFLNTLVGGRVRFGNGAVGVVNAEDRRGNPASFDQVYVDVGATSADDCPVKVGDAAGFYRPYEELGGRLIAKSLDDRIGCAILIEVMHGLKRTPHEAQFVFTVQEEVGTRGAGPSAFGLEPDLALSLDVTRTGDTPKGVRMDVSLGKGAAIKVRDSGMISDPRIVALLEQRAAEGKIAVQREVLEAGTTDATSIQLSRIGVPSGCVSIPCRHIHTPSEMVDLRDVQAAVNLVMVTLERPIEL